MTLLSCIRQINYKSERLKAAYAFLKRHDQSLSKILPVYKQRLLCFIMDTGWSGFIDLEEWYDNTYPKLAGFSSAHIDREKQYELFRLSSDPIILPDFPVYNNWQFTYIGSLRWLEEKTYLKMKEVFSFATAKGRVWVTDVQPDQLPGEKETKLLADRIYTIPFFLSCQVGTSKISLCLLKQVKRGDIVLIQKKVQHLIIGDKAIGTYSIDNEGIMIDLDQIDLDEDSLADIVPSPQGDVGINRLQSPKTIPVTLSFILERKKLNLYELEELTIGKKLDLASDSYKRVTIEANGVTIAMGEMVRIEDNLAVEITAIYPESILR